MQGISHWIAAARAKPTMLLVALALLLRVMIPAGWMPAVGNGYAITLCTGMGTVSAWVDADGTIHKDGPPGDSRTDGTCVFAGFGAAVTLPDMIVPALVPVVATTVLPIALFSEGAIGRGLAAPPPPPTGPPYRT